MDSTTQLPRPVGGDAAAGSPVGTQAGVAAREGSREGVLKQSGLVPAALPTRAPQGGTRLC